jgi:hypothetical protein
MRRADFAGISSRDDERAANKTAGDLTLRGDAQPYANDFIQI